MIRTGVFAKQPVPGQVKTRLNPLLGPILGDSGCSDLALALLRDAATRFADKDLGLELVYTPDQAEAWFSEAFPGHKLRAQCGQDLGHRIAAWFVDVLGEQPGRTAVAVGADSPWTSARRVKEAHDKLRAGADVVLGPDLGGGYYLVGLREPIPGMFTEIEMSTEGMFEATVSWIRERGLKLALQEPDYDLDFPADWHLLMHDLEKGRPVEESSDWPSHLAAFAKRVDETQRVKNQGETS